MTHVQVRPVASRRDRKQFIHTPWQLYQGDPNWIPPLIMDQKGLLNYKRHPFYEDAEIQTFLAERDGKICGRIAAIVNHAHNRRYNEKRGFFGFFESIDDESVSTALFDAARKWLREQGMQSIRGPANPSLNYECGLLIEGFDSPPRFMMTYNPPYYARLVEDYGFRKTHDLLAFWGRLDMLSKLDKKLFFVANEAKQRFGVVLRPMLKSRFKKELELFLRVYNESMGATWGFVPLSSNEIKTLGAGLKHLIVPELALIAEIENKAIGAVFGLLDYNPRIKEIDGRLFPFGFLKLLRKPHEIKQMRVISINVVTEYQRWGLGLVVLGGLIEPMQRWGIEDVEFSWVLESNHLSRGSLEKGGAKLIKTYRLYDYDIPA